MRIERPILTAAFALTLLVNPTCKSPAQPASGGTKVVSAQKVLARLNGEVILEKEFDEFLAITQGELSGDAQPLPRRELFREFLIRKLLLEEARKDGIQVDDVRVEEYLRQWTAREAEEAPGFAQQIREYLAVQKFISERIRPEVNVSLSEILRYYEENSDQFVQEDQAHVLEILFRDRADAMRIRRELEDGDIQDFKERARRYSLGVTASTGGDLGYFQRGDLPEDFENVIFSLKPGQLSDPFESGHGFHIFLIEEWIPRHPQKFFEVRDQIFEILTAEKERSATRAVLNQMLVRASIEIHDSSLDFIEEEGSSLEKYNALD